MKITPQSIGDTKFTTGTFARISAGPMDGPREHIGRYKGLRGVLTHPFDFNMAGHGDVGMFIDEGQKHSFPEGRVNLMINEIEVIDIDEDVKKAVAILLIKADGADLDKFISSAMNKFATQYLIDGLSERLSAEQNYFKQERIRTLIQAIKNKI
jgi:hypothetical protein